MEEQVISIAAMALSTISVIIQIVYNKVKAKYYKSGKFYVKCAKCGNKIYLNDTEIYEGEEQ